MAPYKSREFFTYGDHSFGLTIDSPIRDLKDSEDPTDAILRIVEDRLREHSARIGGCIKYALELDARAYTVYVSGSVVELSRMDGTHSGYSIHLSIFPRVATRDGKANE